MENRIRLLSCLFAIDLCTYAVMSNHYHIVLKVTPEEAGRWSLDDVLDRWCCLYRGTLLVQRYRDGQPLSEAEFKTLSDTVEVLRKRLTCLSWFMKCLNEPMARRANLEDGCKGHFWESRFVSQALSDVRALYSCMAYVDLNPIRARMADTPENSHHTGLRERLLARFDLSAAMNSCLAPHVKAIPKISEKPLLPFSGTTRSYVVSEKAQLQLSFEDYFRLIKLTSEIIRSNQVGQVDYSAGSILRRLALTKDEWLRRSVYFERCYRSDSFLHSKSGELQAPLGVTVPS